MRIGLVILAALLLSAVVLINWQASASYSQQVADPNFIPKVARPAYTTMHPTVLFDEAHNNFHTAGGRYKPFADLITSDGYKVVPNTREFTRESLAGYDILVISNAQGNSYSGADPAFTARECDAVCDWVREGKALLLIADHWPMCTAAANLASRFGVEMMGQGFTDDPANHDKQLDDILFTRENTLLKDHPITLGRDSSERVNRVVTFIGQSMKAPEGSVTFLKLSDTAYNELPGGKRISAANRAQGIALKYGKGRVVVMGEAAMLTAQLAGKRQLPWGGLNTPGIDNKQLALNIMHWLSRLLN
jgi:hypothetical protein